MSVLMYTPGMRDFITENRYKIEQEDKRFFVSKTNKLIRSFLFRTEKNFPKSQVQPAVLL